MIFGTFLEPIHPLTFYPFLFYVVIYMFMFLCIVICMHSFLSAHIFIKSFNVLVLCYNGDIVLNYTAHFVYSPLNSYVYIHWILDFKYILLLLY